MISTIFAILLAVVEKLGVALSVKKIEKVIPSHPVKYLRAPRRWAYLRELESTLERMPFIYRNLKTEVLNDYVEFTSQSLDIDTLSEKSSNSLVDDRKARQRFDEVLRGSKKVLFLGDAGMGKSTFQRYTILKLLKGKLQFVNPKENLLPFFVPLKVVPNYQPYPILSHLLTRTKLLSGKRGLRRLIKYANKQRLFLLLDGYDEIQSAGTESGRNYIREELETMMKSKPFSLDLSLPKSPSLEDFYAALGGCRIWLSSRKAFFKDHPIKMGEVVKSPGVQVLELQGIGENRVRLVKNIFDRYRKQSEQSELFDERYFINQVDEAPDSELSEMSRNPLWLTVMCYTYSTKVVEQQNYEIQAASSFYDLISECLSLLLVDIDKAKVRDLPKIEQEVLSMDRNRYIPEKKAFLEYFAAQLFAEDSVKTIFDFDYLQEKVVSFFEVYEESPNTRRIINSLKSTTTSNFAVQLIYSGVFVIVDKKDQKEFYDFPHMRFREVLAANYFNKYGFSFLLDNLAKPGISELIYVFFNRSKVQEAILKELFAAVLKFPNDEYYQSLISNCLRKSPDGYFPSQELLADFFSKCIDRDSSFRLPTAILTKFQFTEDVGRMLSRGLKKSLAQQKPNALFLCCTLLAKYNKPLLQELASFLLEQLEKGNVIAMQACLAFPDLFDAVRNSQSNSTFVRHFIYLKVHLNQIIKANNDGIPLPTDKREVRECHIFTVEVLDRINDYLTKSPFAFDEALLTNLEGLKDQVYFDDDYLKFIKTKNKLITKRIHRYSALNYEMYRKVMQTINAFPQHPLNKTKFFDKDAYLREFIPQKTTHPQRSNIIDESKPFRINIGGNELVLDIGSLEKGFDAIGPLGFPPGSASVPVKMVFENERILFDIAIYDKQQTRLCEVLRNDWKFNPDSRYDCNSDATTFEIVDADRIPLFQIRVNKSNEIQIGGYLALDDRFDIYTSDATAFDKDWNVAKASLKSFFSQ